MPRPVDPNLPPCDRHPNAKVTRSGTYRRDTRTMVLRCWPARARGAHAFVVRDPGYMPRFRYPASLIARALYELGKGGTYNSVANDARERAHRKLSADTNLTITWLDRFAPRLVEALTPSLRRGGTLLLDQLLFNVNALNERGKPAPGGKLVFVVMGAALSFGAGRPKVVRLFAAPNKSQFWWEQFVAGCAVTPDRIVTDDDDAMTNAAKVRWPKADLVLCHWHLKNRGEVILTKYERNSRTDPLWRSLQGALRTPQGWGRFRNLAGRSGISELDAWVTSKDDRIRSQLHRKQAPSLENLLRGVKKMLIDRRASFEDFDRMDRVLGLTTLQLNRWGNEDRYEEVILRG